MSFDTASASGMTEFTVIVDGGAVNVSEGTLLIDACEKAGIFFPRTKADVFLKSDRFSDIYLVEVNERRPFVNALDVRVNEDMRVRTRLPELDAVRQRTTAALMKDHAPECMTCEKSGECFLQELMKRYFPQTSSDLFDKPLHPPVDLSVFVAYHQNRCVGCGRCVGFLKDFAGTPELALENGVVKLLNPKGLTGEFSSNLTDVCLFGAMTSKIEKEGFRPWNLTRVQSIDLSDTVVSNIRIDASKGQVARILPESDVCAEMNDMWLTNNTRYSFDAMTINRIDKPYVRRNGVLEECSWERAAQTIAERLTNTSKDKILALAGRFADCESMMALQDWFLSLGAHAFDVYGRTFYAQPDVKASWLFNTHLDEISKADALLMVGVDVRSAAAPVNVRLRQNPMPKALVGAAVDLTYPYTYLGNTSALLNDIENDKSAFCRVLETAKYPMIIVGEDALSRDDGKDVSGLCCRLANKYHMVREDWNGYNFLAHGISTLNALALEFLPPYPLFPKPDSPFDNFDFVYLLGAEVPPEKTSNQFVVYQGVFASETALAADVVLPSLSGFEKHATFVNLEGRARSTAPIAAPLGQAREDWKILRYLSEFTSQAVLPYDDLEMVRDHLAGRSVIFYNQGEKCFADWSVFGGERPLEDMPFTLNTHTDGIYSHTMATAFKAQGGVE